MNTWIIVCFFRRDGTVRVMLSVWIMKLMPLALSLAFSPRVLCGCLVSLDCAHTSQSAMASTSSSVTPVSIGVFPAFKTFLIFCLLM